MSTRKSTRKPDSSSLADHISRRQSNRKPARASFADQIVAKAKAKGKTLEEQLEIVRWWRDVNARGNFQAQFACATAIDKLKGLGG